MKRNLEVVTRDVGRAIAVAVASVVLFGVSASSARAGCADPATVGAAAPRIPWAAASGFTAGSNSFSSSEGEIRGTGNAIVGMWQFTCTSKDNPPPFHDGDPLDLGYAQWHSDGTEIMNSSRDPATGNFCLGVWKNVGDRTYKLNHFALSWDNTGTFCTPKPGAPSCFVGVTNIREQVTINPQGTRYTGSVTITQYTPDGQVMFELHGTVEAHRINPD